MSLRFDILIDLECDHLCIKYVNLPEKYYLNLPLILRVTTTQNLPIMNNHTMEIQCSEYRDKTSYQNCV